MRRTSLIQMSGAPGAGKSTIAAELSRRHGMVSIDYDIVKSALLAEGSEFLNAGRTGYRVVTSLAESFLGQGHSVIIDSPCFYQELLDSGESIARRQNAQYLYIECRLDDIDELDRRLGARSPLRSQRSSVEDPPSDDRSEPALHGRELFRAWIQGMRRPATDFLVLDTSRDVTTCMHEVETFLKERKGIE
ncbi:MAG: AAA family ATPase [Jatrophihabitantaceae bacterium]